MARYLKRSGGQKGDLGEGWSLFVLGGCQYPFLDVGVGFDWRNGEDAKKRGVVWIKPAGMGR